MVYEISTAHGCLVRIWSFLVSPPTTWLHSRSALLAKSRTSQDRASIVDSSQAIIARPYGKSDTPTGKAESVWRPFMCQLSVGFFGNAHRYALSVRNALVHAASAEALKAARHRRAQTRLRDEIKYNVENKYYCRTIKSIEGCE